MINNWAVTNAFLVLARCLRSLASVGTTLFNASRLLRCHSVIRKKTYHKSVQARRPKLVFLTLLAHIHPLISKGTNISFGR